MYLDRDCQQLYTIGEQVAYNMTNCIDGTLEDIKQNKTLCRQQMDDENENTTIGNSTGGHSENEAAEEQPVLSAKCAEKDENDAPVDNSKRCRRERQEEEQRRIRMESPEQIEKLLNSNNYQQYSGGFYIRNMRKISKFSKVKMEGLRAQNGGCLHVQLDQNFRELRDAYNKETYRFEELDLYGCLAKKNGGAIFVKNI